jgi:hypothetical protein
MGDGDWATCRWGVYVCVELYVLFWALVVDIEWHFVVDLFVLWYELRALVILA